MTQRQRAGGVLAALAVTVVHGLACPTAMAAHLRPRDERTVRAFVAADGADIEVGDIGVTATEMTVSARIRADGQRGRLRLAARGTTQWPLSATRSFDITWSGSAPTPAAVVSWARGMAGRDDGAWWQADEPAGTAAAPPRLDGHTLAAALAWLLVVATMAGAAVQTLPSAGLVRVTLWAIGGGLLGAEAAWARNGGGPSVGQLQAIAGRAAGPWDGLAAVVHWHLHVPAAWTGCAVAALSVALASASAAALGLHPAMAEGTSRQHTAPLLATVAAVVAVWCGAT